MRKPPERKDPAEAELGHVEIAVKKHPALHVAFTRSQLASLSATGVDYLTTVSLVKALMLWPVVATGFGAAAGALTHFTLGRVWSFRAFHGRIRTQALRYTVVAGSSLVLNSSGLWLLTSAFGWQWFPAKVVVSLSVGFFFNFPMHRYFVFR